MPGASAQAINAWSLDVWAPLSALAFRSHLLLDHYGEVPSTVIASSELRHQIQFSLKYCRTEGKTSEGLLIWEQSGAPVQANKLHMLEPKTNETKITDFFLNKSVSFDLA